MKLFIVKSTFCVVVSNLDSMEGQFNSIDF